jgi:hypothetical protein
MTNPSRGMSTVEHLAVAVLRGDRLAARALADAVLEDARHGAERLPPLAKMEVVSGAVRVVLYAEDPADEWDVDGTERVVREWLSGRRVSLGVANVDRVELYRLPEGETCPDKNTTPTRGARRSGRGTRSGGAGKTTL